MPATRRAIPRGSPAPDHGSKPLTLLVRVTPRGGRDALEGWRDGRLRVRLAAPPAEGRANAAIVRFLAKTAGVALSSVYITGGEASREKRLAFDGIDAATLAQRLGIPLEHFG